MSEQTSEQLYCCSINGNQSGPFNAAQLKQLVEEGRLSKTDSVRREQSKNWHPVVEIKWLFSDTPSSPPQPIEQLFWFYDKKGVEQGPFNDAQLIVQARNKKLPEGKETIIVNAQKQKTTAGNIPWLVPHISKSFAGTILSYIGGVCSSILNTLFLLVLLAVVLAVAGIAACFLIWNTDPYHVYMNWKYPPLNCVSAGTLQESWKHVKKENIDTLPFDDKKEFRETSYELDRLSESIKKEDVLFAVAQDEIRNELDGKRYYNGLKYIVANDLKRKIDKWIEVSNPKIDCTSEETLKDSIGKMINVLGKLDREQYAEIMDALNQLPKMLYAKEIDYSVPETKSYISQRLHGKTIKEIGKFNPRDIPKPKPEAPKDPINKPLAIDFDAEEPYRVDAFRRSVKKMEDALSKGEREKYGDTIDELDRLLSTFDADKKRSFEKVKQSIRKELDKKTFEEINNIGKEKLTSLIDEWLENAQQIVVEKLVEFERYFRWTEFDNYSDWLKYGTPRLKAEYELSRPKTPFEEKDPVIMAKFNSVKDQIKSELDRLKNIQFYQYIDVSGQFSPGIIGPPDGESTCKHSHYDRLLFSPISGKQWDESFEDGIKYKYSLLSFPRLTIDAQGPTPEVQQMCERGKNFKFRVIFNNYQSTHFWHGYDRDRYYGIVHHAAAADVLKFETYYPYMDTPEIQIKRDEYFGRITGMPSPSPPDPVPGKPINFTRYEPIAGLKGIMGNLGLPMTYMDLTGHEYAEYYFSRVMDSLDYKNQVRETYVLSKRLEREQFSKLKRPIQVVDSTGMWFGDQSIGGRQDDYNKLITAGKDRDWLLMINLLLGNDGRYERVDQRIQNVPRVAGKVYSDFPDKPTIDRALVKLNSNAGLLLWLNIDMRRLGKLHPGMITIFDFDYLKQIFRFEEIEYGADLNVVDGNFFVAYEANPFKPYKEGGMVCKWVPLWGSQSKRCFLAVFNVSDVTKKIIEWNKMFQKEIENRQKAIKEGTLTPEDANKQMKELYDKTLNEVVEWCRNDGRTPKPGAAPEPEEDEDKTDETAPESNGGGVVPQEPPKQ